jgi:hypothetical protein
MSKLTRALVVGATLAAMNLAGMTAVAQAHVTEYTIKPYASSPLEPRAGESYHHRQVVSQQQTATSDAVELFRRGERASQQQTAADAALRRMLAQEHSSIPSGIPAQVPAPVQPDEPSGQAGWLVASLGVLAAVLVLIAGLAVLAAKRASRRARAGQAA